MQMNPVDYAPIPRVLKSCFLLSHSYFKANKKKRQICPCGSEQQYTFCRQGIIWASKMLINN